MVVPVDVLRKSPAKGAFADEPEVVGAFFLDAADHAFGVGVHVRRAWGGADRSDAAAGEDVVESGPVESAVMSSHVEVQRFLQEDRI